MNYIFNFILSLVDFFYQRKIKKFLKKNIKSNINTLIDVGAHKGETIITFLQNFKVNNIYSFEASFKNYLDLKKNIVKFKKNYPKTNIEIFNDGVGNDNSEKFFYDLSDTNSSTFNKINQDSSYFKRKNKILSFFFFKKDFFSGKKKIKQIRLFDFINTKKLNNIDIIKIDTEGYEFEVLKGLDDKIKDIKFIYFEHHYDNMIEKTYKFSDMHYLLTKKNFKRVFKIKMPFRKSFDYIYQNLSK